MARRNMRIEQLDKRELFAVDFGMIGTDLSVPLDDHLPDDDEVAIMTNNEDLGVGDQISVKINNSHGETGQRNDDSIANVDSFFREVGETPSITDIPGINEVADWSGNCFGGC